MNITIFPADLYTVVSKSNVDFIDKKIISMLYQPIIGYTAVSLYFTLLDDIERNETKKEDIQHYHLMSIMQLKLDDIVIAREKLEAVGLLKTYIKEENVNNYIYQLFSPLPANEFLTHPILSVVLYNNLGKKEYNNVVDYFKVPKYQFKDYKDITKSFNQVFTSINGNPIESNDIIISKEYNNLMVNSKVDFNLLIESIPKNMYSEKCFSDEVKDLINNLCYIYKIDTLEMASLIRTNLNERGLIDKTNLRKDARNYYQFDNSGRLPTVIYKTQPEYLRNAKGDSSKRAKLIYSFETTSPYDFIASKYQGGEPTSRDIRLIESLMIDQKLNPGVINVLLSYVMHTNNNRLNKSLIETIAGQWKRNNIETVEEALNIADKEYKKGNKNVPKKTYTNKTEYNETLPAWFDKDLTSSEVSQDEQEEMNKLINDLTI